MNAASRQRRIQELVESVEFIDVRQLGEVLGASASTVRRDLVALDRRGALQKVRGGALAPAVRDDRLDFAWRSARNRAEKEAIGRVAAGLVEDGQTVILDGGSTAAAVARNLLGRRLQIVTSSIPISQIFLDSRTAEVTLTGGYLYPRLGVLLGPFCERMLRSVSADVLIMGIGGITESGFSNSNSLIVSSERIMLEVSRKVIIVADHTKFGRRAMVDLAPLDAAHVVVSDAAVDERSRALVEDAGVTLLLDGE